MIALCSLGGHAVNLIPFSYGILQVNKQKLCFYLNFLIGFYCCNCNHSVLYSGPLFFLVLHGSDP